MCVVRTPTWARSLIESSDRAPATMSAGATPRARRFCTMRPPRWPEVAVTTKDMVRGPCSGSRVEGCGCGRSGGEQPEDEHGDREGQRRQRHCEVLQVVHP